MKVSRSDLKVSRFVIVDSTVVVVVVEVVVGLTAAVEVVGFVGFTAVLVFAITVEFEVGAVVGKGVPARKKGQRKYNSINA